ncbi:MAG: phenylacetate-CoA oxygenase subunit PaaJ [Alicyclobacillus sp.]|nr:phenylacetate-CoA oxygenase subunit PaaJ [Alicyclobacillus sp.]
MEATERRRPELEGLRQRVWDALAEVADPELPAVSVVDLGMVGSVDVEPGGTVSVRMLPTFVGCPALAIIEGRVRERLAAVDGATTVEVRFDREDVWTTERLRPEAADKLRSLGIAAPPCRLRERPVDAWRVACPYCGSTDTALQNLFGPTACRALYTCNQCRQPFEVMKPV